MILCCGEALIDMIPRQTRGGGGQEAYVPYSGGSVFNTAIALGRLGVSAGMLTGLSADRFGRQLAAELTASLVDTSYCVTTSRPSTIAVLHMNDGQAAYTFYDENSALRGIRAQDLRDIGDEVNCLFFGGISLCHAPAADVLLELAERHAARLPVMVAPNIRPGFIRAPDAYRDRLERIISLASIVKVSEEDLDWIFPEAATLQDKIARILDIGPGLAVLTRGASGVAGFRRDGRLTEAVAHPAEVADTVGAGDTFNAGFLVKASELGLLTPGALEEAEDSDLAACLAFGARAVAVTVSRAGANPPWRHELKDITGL
ncbi:carbohydrate kinase family protein [Cribrihabitans pelagius]|uniref:carbohydrate kinase family protein n=1 Tax=Cribrihabitans pelagius TaxID=1765746 RepID=UPI003B5AE417